MRGCAIAAQGLTLVGAVTLAEYFDLPDLSVTEGGWLIGASFAALVAVVPKPVSLTGRLSAGRKRVVAWAMAIWALAFGHPALITLVGLTLPRRAPARAHTKSL